jgi:multidrug resistance efflux pump
MLSTWPERTRESPISLTRKNQQLFRIYQRRFQYALDQATADLASEQADLDQAKRDLVRNESLTNVAITQQQV